VWHVVAAVAMVAVGVAVTFDAWADIYHIASIDEEYSHIFLVPIVAAYLVWVRRVRFRFCTPTGTMIGPVLAAAGWGISAYGFYHNVQAFWHAGAVLAVVGCLLSVVGKNVLFRFFPAFAVLIFLVPVPGMVRQEIALPLQSWTAQIGQSLLEILGVETARSGNQLSVNGIPVAIAEACNGLRMVFALILVSYAFSFGLPLRNSVRFAVLLASPLAAIGCNVIRIVPTVWLYGYHSKQVADAFHDYSGWVMLPIAFAILYGIICLLKWAMIPVTRYTLASQA
jgi:exosortase